MITLCEKCYPHHGAIEVLTVTPIVNCEACGSSGRRHVFRSDPRSKPPIFVFGSNLAGRHGKGAALHARKHWGAIYGRGIGRQGNSFAIPTKDGGLHTLPLSEIQQYVNGFLFYAREHPELTFQVTAIGTGLAGYSADQIGPMFADAPANCNLCDVFEGFRTENL